MPAPRVLPDDSVLLRERDFEGLTLTQIAARYNVSKSAVSQRFDKMGRPWGGHSGANAPLDYQAYIPWDVDRSHMALDAAIRLRAHIRYRMGEEVTDAAMKRLRNWWIRLDRDHTVLTYDPERVGSPWHYEPRETLDGSLVLRWPNTTPLEDQVRDVLSLPEVPA